MYRISCDVFFYSGASKRILNSKFKILNYLASEVCELLAESLAGEEDAALHCADREVELLGYLAVLVTCNVHVERDAELVVEGVDDGCDLLHRQAPFRSLKSRFLRCVQVVEVVGGVDDRRLAHVAAVVVDEDVAHDRHHPALEVGVGGELLLVVERLERGVLKEVGGCLAVGGELVGEAEQV